MHVGGERADVGRSFGDAVGDVGQLQRGPGQIVPHPGRVAQDVEDLRRPEARRNRHPGAQVALAVPLHRHVDRQAQSVIAALAAALDEAPVELGVAQHVDLEHLRPRGRGADVLDGVARQRRQGVEGPRPVGGPRHRHLPLPMKQPRHAGGRQQDRPIDLHAQHGRRQVGRRDVDQIARHQVDFAERLGVAPHRALVLGGAIDVLEHRCRHPAPGQAAQVGDVVAAVESSRQR